MPPVGRAPPFAGEDFHEKKDMLDLGSDYFQLQMQRDTERELLSRDKNNTDRGEATAMQQRATRSRATRSGKAARSVSRTPYNTS
jgi:hypothetical protein